MGMEVLLQMSSSHTTAICMAIARAALVSEGEQDLARGESRENHLHLEASSRVEELIWQENCPGGSGREAHGEGWIGSDHALVCLRLPSVPTPLHFLV